MSLQYLYYKWKKNRLQISIISLKKFKCPEKGRSSLWTAPSGSVNRRYAQKFPGKFKNILGPPPPRPCFRSIHSDGKGRVYYQFVQIGIKRQFVNAIIQKTFPGVWWGVSEGYLCLLGVGSRPIYSNFTKQNEFIKIEISKVGVGVPTP